MILSDKILSCPSDASQLIARFDYYLEPSEFEKLIKTVAKDPLYSYRVAIHYKEAGNPLSTKYLEEFYEFLTPHYYYMFARHISNADIQRCQEGVLKDPGSVYNFALDIPGADVELLEKHMDKVYLSLYHNKIVKDIIE